MLKRPGRLRLVGTATAVALVSVVALVGTGFNRSVVRVLDVGAWVRSITQGSVQHVNGASGKVDETLRVPIASDPGTELVNTAHGAALLDTRTGKLQMIDTTRLNQTSAPTSAGHGGDVDLVGNGSTVWLVQPQQGTAATISPSRGPSVALPKDITSTAVDGQGRLWVVSGDRVVSAEPNGKLGRAITVGNPGDHIELTTADGVAYAYDQSTQSLIAPGISGATPIELPLTPGATGVVTADQGDPSGGWVSIVVPQAGVVMRVNPHTDTTQTITLSGRSDHNLGGAVAVGAALLVPDHTTGELAVINPQTGSVHPWQVTVPGSRSGAFDLEVKNGIAYANDPSGNQCLVVSSGPNGTQVSYVTKYQVPRTPRRAPGPTPVPSVSHPVPVAPTPAPATPAPAPVTPTPAPALPLPGPAPARPAPARPAPARPAPPAPVAPPSHQPVTPALPTRAPGPPAPPTGVTATPGNATITVRWTPAAPAGNPATSWVVSWGGSVNQQVTGVSTTITGLTNGQPYHVTVRARNAAGESAAVVAAPDPVTPQAAVPGAPTGVRLTPANGSATVRWTAPSGPVSHYQITTQPAAAGQPQVVPAGRTSATVPGLTNGTPYEVTVAAVGPSGGASSASAGPVTPFGAPGRVSGIIVNQSGASGFAVSFGGAAANGSRVTGYQVTATGSGAPVTNQGPTSPISLSGLTVGATYTISVRAKNAAGWGTTTSGGSHEVELVAAVSITITPGSQSATVNISVNPNGDPTPSSCVVETSGLASMTSAGCAPVTVSGLTAGQNYTIDAYAVINGLPTTRSAAQTATPYFQASVAHTYDTPTNIVKLHSAPSQTAPQTGSVTEGQSIQILCQTTGSTVPGTLGGSSDVWDKLTNGSYITDLLTSTPNSLQGTFSPGIAQCA